MSLDDEKWLRRAIWLAERSLESGDQPFGTVVVSAAGEVLVETTQTRLTSGDCTAHSEIRACSAASKGWPREELAGATLYTNVEPCLMCTGAIGWSGIGRLVYGLAQTSMQSLFPVPPFEPPRFRAPHSCRQLLDALQPPIVIVGPLLEAEAAEPHRRYAAMLIADQRTA